MSGQRKNYSEYEKQINEYVRNHPPHAPSKPCDIDLHALGLYLKENNISNKDVTPEIVEKFKLFD